MAASQLFGYSVAPTASSPFGRHTEGPREGPVPRHAALTQGMGAGGCSTADSFCADEKMPARIRSLLPSWTPSQIRSLLFFAAPVEAALTLRWQSPLHQGFMPSYENQCLWKAEHKRKFLRLQRMPF